jgi:hypothetical protein
LFLVDFAAQRGRIRQTSSEARPHPAIAENYLGRARRGLVTPTEIEAALAAKGCLPPS